MRNNTEINVKRLLIAVFTLIIPLNSICYAGKTVYQHVRFDKDAFCCSSLAVLPVVPVDDESDAITDSLCAAIIESYGQIACQTPDAIVKKITDDKNLFALYQKVQQPLPENGILNKEDVKTLATSLNVRYLLYATLRDKSLSTKNEDLVNEGLACHTEGSTETLVLHLWNAEEERIDWEGETAFLNRASKKVLRDLIEEAGELPEQPEQFTAPEQTIEENDDVHCVITITSFFIGLVLLLIKSAEQG